MTTRSRAPNRDVFPTYAFTPDSKSIMIGHYGHFWRADVATGKETMTPFTADVDEMIAVRQHLQYAYNDTSMFVRQVRDVKPSPDGRRLAFVALIARGRWTCRTARRSVSPQTRDRAIQPAGRRWAVTSPTSRGTTSTAARRRARARTAWSTGEADAASRRTTRSRSTRPTASGIVVGRGPRNMHKDPREDERPPAAAIGVELGRFRARRQRNRDRAELGTSAGRTS